MIRLLDLIFSSLGIIFLFPLLLLIWLLNKIINKSSLFSQTRVGRNQRRFNLIKFRTMPIGTKSKGTHLIKNIELNTFSILLRKTKLDEIPQLWNVFIGDMSLVGPRPCLINQKKLIVERRKRAVFKVKPGITGLAQISGINMQTPILLAKTDSKMIKKLNTYYYFYYILQTLLLILKK